MFLTDAQLEELTGKRQYAAQRRALRSMGVFHRVRPDGRPLVMAADLRVQSGKQAVHQKDSCFDCPIRFQKLDAQVADFNRCRLMIGT